MEDIEAEEYDYHCQQEQYRPQEIRARSHSNAVDFYRDDANKMMIMMAML